jgi:hypothetical protein
MKQLLTITFIALNFHSFGQDKTSHVLFNKLTEVAGTEYVIASIENVGKMFSTNSKYLLFVNTKSGQTNQIDFPKDGYVEKIEQIKIDSLAINKIIISAKTINLNGKKGIDWEDPTQIIILSTDGQQKIQLTEDKFFVHEWTINRQTGTIVITGFYDSNNNNKFDKTDKDEILIYDLRTLKLISRI